MAARRKIKRIRYSEPECENWDKLSEDEKAIAVREWPRYYKEHYGKTQLRKFFVKWAKTVLPKKDMATFRAGLGMSTYLDGAWAKIIMRGYVPKAYYDHLLNTRVPIIMEAGRKEIGDVVPEKKDGPAPKKLTIQERVKEASRALIGEIDNEIDIFISNKCKKPKFDLYKFLQKNEVKGPHTKIIAEHLNGVLDEIAELVEGKDAQLNEGYDFLTKTQQAKYRDFLSKMVADTTSWTDVLKVKRKPRKRKVHSVQKQTSQVKYKERDDEYKIASVSPTKIVGATQVWIFDCKNRFLFKYVSSRGMVVKGTTIKDFDKTSSFKKKIRKPDVILPDVMKGGKVKLRKLMDTIKAKETKVTGRINSDMVILRVI